MTVGILTYHWQDDYGSALQAYAMRLAIEATGHLPVFIDLCLPYAPSQWERITGAFRHRRFEEFRRLYLGPISHLTYRSLADLRRNPPLCDCYVTAGPRVWNPEVAGALLPAYFLAFGPESTRRIAYAPSSCLMRWEDVPLFRLPEISRALSRFTSILLPSASEIDICRKSFGHQAFTVVEPVFLFDSYPELTGSVETADETVMYMMSPQGSLESVASTFASSTGAPLHKVGSYSKAKALGALRTDSVKEWISRLAGARMVITDSPEVLAIALLHHRPFAVSASDAVSGPRIRTLLASLGLSGHIIPENDDGDGLARIAALDVDWNKTDQRLGALRAESWRLLRQALI